MAQSAGLSNLVQTLCPFPLSVSLVKTGQGLFKLVLGYIHVLRSYKCATNNWRLKPNYVLFLLLWWFKSFKQRSFTNIRFHITLPIFRSLVKVFKHLTGMLGFISLPNECQIQNQNLWKYNLTNVSTSLILVITRQMAFIWSHE